MFIFISLFFYVYFEITRVFRSVYKLNSQTCCLWLNATILLPLSRFLFHLKKFTESSSSRDASNIAALVATLDTGTWRGIDLNRASFWQLWCIFIHLYLSTLGYYVVNLKCCVCSRHEVTHEVLYRAFDADESTRRWRGIGPSSGALAGQRAMVSTVRHRIRHGRPGSSNDPFTSVLAAGVQWPGVDGRDHGRHRRGDCRQLCESHYQPVYVIDVKNRSK